MDKMIAGTSFAGMNSTDPRPLQIDMDGNQCLFNDVFRQGKGLLVTFQNFLLFFMFSLCKGQRPVIGELPSTTYYKSTTVRGLIGELFTSL